MELEDLHIFKASINLGKLIWADVINWDQFSKNTLGNQLIRSVQIKNNIKHINIMTIISN